MCAPARAVSTCRPARAWFSCKCVPSNCTLSFEVLIDVIQTYAAADGSSMLICAARGQTFRTERGIVTLLKYLLQLYFRNRRTMLSSDSGQLSALVRQCSRTAAATLAVIQELE